MGRPSRALAIPAQHVSWGRLASGPGGFIVLVLLFSWPLMAAGRLLDDPWPAHAASMLAVAAAAMVHSRLTGKRLVFWSTGGKPYIAAAVAIPLAVYALPLLEAGQSVSHALALAIVLQLVLNLAPAWGEEAGWRSYFYGTLLEHYKEHERLLIHGVTWVLWHLPAVAASPAEFLQFAVAAPLGVLHATLFAWLYRGGGVAAATLYHALYDALRDAILVLAEQEAAASLAVAAIVVSAAGAAAFVALVRGEERRSKGA